MSAWIASCYSADTGVDGSGNPVSATSITANLIHGAASGNTVLLAILGGGGKTVASVTDTGGNTWTRDKQQVNGTVETVEIWRSNITHGLGTTDSITITFSATNAFHMAVGELYTGTFTPDQSAACTPATTTAPTTAATPATTHSVETVFGALAVGGGSSRPTFTPTPPYSVRQTHSAVNSTSNSGRNLYSMDTDVSATGAQTVSGTLSVADPWTIDCVTYYTASGGGAGQTLLAGFATPAGTGSAIQAKMLGVGIRGSGPDITGAYASYPWVKCISVLDFWSNIEATDNTYTFTQFAPSFQSAITNGYVCGLRIECARDGAPSWIYSANSIGAVQSLITYPGGNTSSPTKTPVPWDPNLRLLGARLYRAIQSFLNTSFGGKTYRDVCAFVSVSVPTAVEGTEMTIGDEGSSANTANWNAVLNGQTARQNAYGQAWINSTLDAMNNISAVNISVASGTVWGDGRAQFMGLCDYMAANLTSGNLARLIVGPTDMRVDQPGANSYAAWSAAADQAMTHALSKGLRNWAQTAGWSWWGQTFNGGTLAAIQTAYGTDAVGLYQCELMETNTQILGNVTGLPSWMQNTLQPEILAQQWSIGTGGGSQAFGPTLAISSGTGQVLHPGYVPQLSNVPGPSFVPGAVTLHPGHA